MEFVETPSFLYPHVDRAACTNFSTWTVELRPSEGQEILHFSFSSFLSFSFFLFLFIFSFLSFPTNSFLSLFFFLCFSFFSFLFSFLFFSFCFSFLFLFPLFLPLTQRILFGSYLISFYHSCLLIFSFLLAISLLLRISIDRIGQRRKLPPFFLQATCVVLDFPHFSFISLLPFITSSLMCLIVSHTFKCTTWLLPCVTFLGCHVASLKSHHVSFDTLCLEKREISTVSEFDKIRCGI